MDSLFLGSGMNVGEKREPLEAARLRKFVSNIWVAFFELLGDGDIN